jgi:malonyl-CoA/methylmalonyl-CoA synthetase
LCCPLWAGATVEFLPHYSAQAVWERISLGVGNALEQPWISVLMGVPTVYAQLIEAYEQMERKGDAIGTTPFATITLAWQLTYSTVGQCHLAGHNSEGRLVRCMYTGMASARAGCRAIRLMVSGSAALPMSVLEKWERISGTVLLERYGMTEFAMALSNPLDEVRLKPFLVVRVS